jgi:hypothetical protein
MAYEAYIGYLDDHGKEIAGGEPFVLEVREQATFERKVVRAIVAESEGDLPGGEPLWITDWVEKRQEKPWSIRVLEELEEGSAVRADVGEDEVRASAEESERFTGKRYKGATLPDMMGQDEIRTYHRNIVEKGRSPSKKD